MQFWAPDDGQKTRLKHVERLTEINKLWNVAHCWLYSASILAMYTPPYVKNTQTSSKCGKLEMVIWQLEAIMECRIRFSNTFKLLLHIKFLNALNILGWLTTWFCARTHCNWEGTLNIVLFIFGARAPYEPWPTHSRGFYSTYKDAPQSVRFLWTSDQFVAETSRWQNTTLTTHIYKWPRRDSKPHSQQASGRRHSS